MRYLHTTKEVASQLSIPYEVVRIVGRDLIGVQRLGNSYMWTWSDIDKMKRIKIICSRKLKEL